MMNVWLFHKFEIAGRVICWIDDETVVNCTPRGRPLE